jgi:hypothetical protein
MLLAATNAVLLSLCTPQIPHGLPTDRPGLRVSSEHDYKTSGGLDQDGGTTSALTKRYGETAENRPGYQANKR